ncbi:TRAP transporter small permease [Chloroflexota bacterium]
MRFWLLVDSMMTRICNWYVIVAEIAAAVIMLISVIDVVGSKLFNQAIPSAAELVAQLNVPLVFGAIAFIVLERGHIRIDTLESRFSIGLNFVFKLISHALVFAVSGFLSWRALILLQDNIVNIYRNSGTWTFLLWPFVLSVLIGLILLALASVVAFGRTLRAGPEENPPLPEQPESQAVEELSNKGAI